LARLELRPFSVDHVAAASALLAERHRGHRAAEPLVPAAFESPAAAHAEVARAWAREGASGAVALRDGRLAAYAIGVPGDVGVWGPSIWVDAAGHAAQDTELARDVYAAAASRWVDEGRTRHYVELPAFDRAAIDAWSRLSFGQQQAYAIREVHAEPWPPLVRPAEPRDVDALVALAPLLRRQHREAPVFSAGPAWDEDTDALRADIEQGVVAPDIGSLVAEVDGRLVGNFEVVPLEMSSTYPSLGRAEGACFLAFAVTAPEARGAGVGVALTAAAFAWAAERGYSAMATDWRVTNLLASRFWPRRGFRATFLRLYRSIP
jgi:GNAT superfamily N-acetyltransferase